MHPCKRFFVIATAALLLACEPQPAAPTPTQGAENTVTYAAEGALTGTLPELSSALATGAITSQSLTEDYLERIARIDRQGPTLRSILAINPDALAQAQASDRRRAAAATLGPLDGVPILLKDNIEATDPMATTAGAVALSDNITGRDSPLVAGLRAGGAVILGKTNLSQWANFRSNESISGWSAQGGQVQNPHILNRSPCGSSSGSGAAVAASLGAGAVGTETNGSIICPANVNGIVGFKPTVGLLSAQFIVPISPSQDTAGPMTKTVRGAALMLDTMAGSGNQFTAALDRDALSGKRIAVLRFDQGDNADIIDRFEAALAILAEAGATLIDVTDFGPISDAFWDDQYRFLLYEFKASINAYLAATPETVIPRNLAELIQFNAQQGATELALFDQDIFEEAQTMGDLGSADYLALKQSLQRTTRDQGIDHLLETNNADLLVAPSGPLTPPRDAINGDIWPEWAGSGYLAAIAGYPHLTVPMGSVHGIPIGLSFIGTAGRDQQLLAAGYAYEQLSQERITPLYLPSAELHPDLQSAIAGP